MNHRRLKELSVLLLREAKSLLASGDPSAFTLTDPVLDSGSPKAQTFGDSRGGDSDYELWIRLLRLHGSAQRFVDQGEGALAGLQEQILDFEKLLSAVSRKDGGATESRGATVPVD
jgi:hypothetical protein